MNQSYESNPVYQQNGQYPPDSAPMSVKSWIGTNLLLMIPIANIILLFIWAFGSGGNLNKKNYAKAALILAGCAIVLYVVLIVIVVGLVINGSSDY